MRVRRLSACRVKGGEIPVIILENSSSGPGRTELLAEVEKSTGVPSKEILRPSRNRKSARARALYCYLCREKAGVSGTELRRELGIGQSAVSRLTEKGRKLMETSQLVI